MLSIPKTLLAAAADHLKMEVISAVPLAGGYTPQQVLRLELGNGERIVLKGAPPHREGAPGPVWGDILTREIEAYCRIVELGRWMPRYIGDFTSEGWRVLLLEDLSDADRVPPWTERTIDLVASGLADMHRATLGIVPPPYASYPASPSFFRSIAERGRVLGDIPSGYDHPDWWNWLEEATAAGEAALTALGTETPRCMVHFDVRSDNLFLRSDRLLLIDWSDPAWETPAADSVYWALGVELETGRSAHDIHNAYLRHLPELDEDAIRYALAFCLGCFLASSQLGGVPERLVDIRRRFIAATAPWFSDLCGIRPMPAAR